MPPSVMLGRIPTPGEPLWTQDDTDLALALTEVEGERHSCGHSRLESMDPDNEFGYGAEAVRCHACAAVDRAMRKVPDGMDSAGINWISTRKG